MRSDEVWYFHWGSPLKLHLFSEGTYKDVLLGTDLISNQHIQYIIEAGTVFGAETTPNGRGSLVSCSVTPGFNELDFHWVETNEMIGKYPEKRALIRKLIR